MLDLSSNKIKTLLPPGVAISALAALKLPSLLSLNISDNPIRDLKNTTDYIACIMPEITDLQISLFDEQDVDYIINKLTKLTYLNNLPVDRSELFESGKAMICASTDQSDQIRIISNPSVDSS
jgi:Leucine-rich repeat (LRR) protein